jgi:hypothetical protein
MATLQDLVATLSATTGVPEATIFAYGRFARQAGLVSQKGRGRQAASMSLQDAANLVIALGGTGVTRDADDAISSFRSLKGRAYAFSTPLEEPFLHWLDPLRPRLVRKDGSYPLGADLGQTIEFLISSTTNGTLVQLFGVVPVAEIPDKLFHDWKRTKSIHLDQSLDYLIEQGLIKPKTPQELEFGEDINLELNFSRQIPALNIEFKRVWHSAETALELAFGPVPEPRR